MTSSPANGEIPLNLDEEEVEIIDLYYKYTVKHSFSKFSNDQHILSQQKGAIYRQRRDQTKKLVASH